MSAAVLPAAVRTFLDQVAPGAAVVVAVSGGADSVALLRATLETGRPVVLAHLNHCLRKAESDGDEEFVRELHGRLAQDGAALTLHVGRIDIASLASTGGENVEGVARRERYAWLAQVAASCKLGLVATGHTADDQAETVLHRLLRGSGIAGLRGIAARRELAPTVELVRPLLEIHRADVLAYLDGLRQPYRQDSSNADPAFTRNRLRHQLLPTLARDYNPAVVRVLAQLAAQAHELTQVLGSVADERLAAAELPRAGERLVFRHDTLAQLARPLLREVLRAAWARENWPQGGMSFAAWDRLAGVVLDDVTAVDLPGGIRARREGRVVQVGPVW